MLTEIAAVTFCKMTRTTCFRSIENTSTYSEYLLESFEDEYERDERYEYLLHEPCEISDEESALEHDDKYRKDSNPHTDPQTKDEKLHSELVTHLHTHSTQRIIRPRSHGTHSRHVPTTFS